MFRHLRFYLHGHRAAPLFLLLLLCTASGVEKEVRKSVGSFTFRFGESFHFLARFSAVAESSQ